MYDYSVPAGNVISTSYSKNVAMKQNEIEESQQGGIHEGDSVVVTVSAGPEPNRQRRHQNQHSHRVVEEVVAVDQVQRLLEVKSKFRVARQEFYRKQVSQKPDLVAGVQEESKKYE